ncbi:MAG TPA: chromate efflux transporter [Abditibacteriaceae bacterium]|jgi:chromate transporter
MRSKNTAVTPEEYSQSSNTSRLRDLALLFGRLGATAFGGPAAHIAMMEDEVVTRRGWMTRQQFLDLVGATNLIPGPNSTELAIHIGKLRAGWPGLVVAGVCFILPAFCLVLLLAWLYETYGALPQMQWLLRGMAPVVCAIIVQALWKFAGTALKHRLAWLVALASCALLALRVHELTVLGLAALAGLLASVFAQRSAHPSPHNNATSTQSAAEASPADFTSGTEDDRPGEEPASRSAPLLVLAPVIPLTSSATGLFWSFLKIGSILYGSGYVLIAFLQADLVPRLLTQRQLIDAVAIGQVTPGPVFTTATFIGFQIAGWTGAVAATVGIFLPSFLFVALLSMLMERLKTSLLMRWFLDAVNAASLALMAWATMLLARSSLTNLATIIVAIVSLVLLLRTRLNATWLLAGGALIGWLMRGA